MVVLPTGVVVENPITRTWNSGSVAGLSLCNHSETTGRYVGIGIFGSGGYSALLDAIVQTEDARLWKSTRSEISHCELPRPKDGESIVVSPYCGPSHMGYFGVLLDRVGAVVIARSGYIPEMRKPVTLSVFSFEDIDKNNINNPLFTVELQTI